LKVSFYTHLKVLLTTLNTVHWACWCQ